MLYVSSVGPIDPETDEIVNGSTKEHTRQCLANLKAMLEASGSSLDRIAWASCVPARRRGLRHLQRRVGPLVPGDAPVGQSTLMPPLQRRAGFRVSLGVIAEA